MENNFEAPNKKLELANRLTTALFIEYGDDNDPTSRTRAFNLAADIVAATSKTPEKSSEEILSEVKKMGGYGMLDQGRGIIEDDYLIGIIGNIKSQL